jgi:hypothetical protein
MARPYGSPFRLPPRWRWITGPVLALGGGGTAIALYEQVLIQGLLRQFAPWLFAAAVGFGGLWLTACWWESAGEYLLRPRG